jgi:hypothetical protein
MAAFGGPFCHPSKGDRKVTLNFAPITGYSIDPSVIRECFDPDRFLIKLTPLNPTLRSSEGGMRSVIDHDSPQTGQALIDEFTREGFEVILSIGEVDENMIAAIADSSFNWPCRETKVLQIPITSSATEPGGVKQRT